MAETYILGAGEQTALRPFNEWLTARQGRKDKPSLTAEQIESARKAWRKAATKAAGLEESPPTGTQPVPTPPSAPTPDPRVPAGGYREAEQAGRATQPPKPPAAPTDSLVTRAGRAVFGPSGTGDYQPGVGEQIRNAIEPTLYGASEAYRALKAPFEDIGAEVTGALKRGSLQVGREGHRTRDAAYRALRAMGMSEEAAKHRAHQAERGVKEQVAPLAGGVIEYLPEVTAAGEIAEGIPLVARGEKALERIGPKVIPKVVQRITPRLAPTVGKAVAALPRSLALGAGIGGATRFAKGEIGERDPTTGQVIPPATGEDISEAARQGAAGFTEAELATRALGYAAGAPFRIARSGVPDWFEGSTGRPKTENQGTPDQPTPPVRDDQDPAFVREANKEETPPTAGKKEPAAPGLSAQNERTDKPGSGAGGTDPDDDGTQSAGKGPTSASVPPGVAPGDIREGDAVKPTPAGQGTSDQFKPRPEGPIRDYFTQLEEEHRQRQEAADNAARTAEIGPRRETGAPRNLMDYYRRLRGEPAGEPAAPVSRAERQGLPRTLMEYLRNPRGYAETRAAAPAGPRGPRVLRPGGPDVVARLLRQLRGEEPEAQPGPPVVPEERGWPTALIDEQRREREAEEAQRQTQVEKQRQAAGAEELAQRVRNRQERETAAAGQSRLLRILGRDREQRALEAMRGVERPGVEWTGPIPPRERPYEGEGWRWPEEPPKPPKAPKPPKPPVEPEAPEEVVEEVEQEEPKKEPARTAQVSFMITRAQEAALRDRGYSDADIGKMKPAEAHQILSRPVEPEAEPTKPKEPEPPEAQKGVIQRAMVAAKDRMLAADPGTRDYVHYRTELQRAARALKEVASPEEAIETVRALGDGPVERALKDIFGDQLKRPKTAAPGGRPGRGKVEAAKPTTASVLPPEEPKKPAEPEAPKELEPELEDEEVSLRGKDGTLHVEDFPNTPFRYEVVERGDLVTSHDTEGNPNPEYPEDLQQRALDRDAYQETQREIKTNMQPERLGEAPSAIEGAPVVTHLLEGNVVLGGKQRVAALQALEEGSDADETYQNWLYKHAADFGIDPTGLEGFARPTLIRRLTRRLTPEEARDFAPNTDVSPSMELSPSEKARMDARRLTPAMLEQLDVTESGNLNTEGNLPFIRAFMAQLPRTARNLLTTDNGFLNDDGLRRVQNAVLARAYSIGKELHPAIARMFESTDEKTKTIQHALLRAAPDFAVYRGAVDEGDLEMVDTMTPLLNGAATVSALRNNRMTIQDWLDQEKLGGKDPLEQAVMQAYRDNTTVPTLTDYLKDMANLLHNLPSKKAGDLFDRPPTPTPLQVFHLLRDPDLVSLDTEDAERVQQAIRDLDREIRTARAQGDLSKVERLEEQKKALQKKAPC